jgi:Uma2 family endonuclease
MGGSLRVWVAIESPIMREAMNVSTKPITYEDSLTMPENKLEEIVNGESRIMPPPTDQHASLLEELAEMLRSQLSREYRVLPAGYGLGIRRSPVLTYRIPDLAVFQIETWRQNRAQKAHNDPYVWKAPELLVECLSPSNRKGPIRELIANYESIAVPELWLLEPRISRLTAYRYDDHRLRIVDLDQHVVSPVRLPNVRIDLDRLWQVYHQGW